MTDLRPLFHWSLPTPYPVSEEAIADARVALTYIRGERVHAAPDA